MKEFVNSQFGYYILVWMFRNRTLNNRISRIHERAFRIVCCDETSSFRELLQKGNKMTVDQKNLQVATIGFYKVKMRIAPNLIRELFPLAHMHTISDLVTN